MNRKIAFSLGCAAGLLVLIVASIMIGSRFIPPQDVMDVLVTSDDSIESTIIHGQRIPRTILVILVGLALGVAGALMQALTRNPLADPGVMGINAGASLAVVAACAVFNTTSIWFYLWFAFAGAAVAAVAVYVLGGVGKATMARLALAGVAVSMAVSSLVQLVLLGDQNVFNEFRLWAAGSAENRGYPVIAAVVGFIVLGLILSFIASPGLNALALGEDAGRALGVNVSRLRVLIIVAITLSAGAATAAVGPIMFIGLGVPYLARAVCGPDQRWVLPLSALSAPVVMLAADILARVLIYPQEIQTGIVTAIIGGPIFILILRQRKASMV